MEFETAKDPLRLKLASWLLSLLRASSSYLPLRLLVSLGALLGRCFLPFFPREKKVMQAQLTFVSKSSGIPDTAPWIEEKTQREIMSDCFSHVGESIAEVFSLKRLLSEEAVHHISLEHEQRFHSFFQGGKGVLALSGHIGCFELLAASHAHRGVPVAVVGRRPNYEGIGKLLGELRSGYGVETIWRDDASGGRKIFSWLKGGKVLAVLLDQDTDLESRFPRFFGLQAASPVAPVRIAIKLGIPMISTFIVRKSHLEHEVVTEVLEYDKEDPEAELKILQEFNHRLERLIVQSPGQWLWWHRRWRREPQIDYKKESDSLRGTAAYLQWLERQSASAMSNRPQQEAKL